MKGSRKRFGPLFYVTSSVALLILASRPFWEAGEEQYRAWRLVGRLGDASEAIDRAATEGLVQLGPSATSWVLRAMRSRDPLVRRRACSILLRTTSERGEELLAALLVAARDSDPSVRSTAVGQLEAMVARYDASPDSSLRDRALEALGQLLGDQSPQVRSAVGWAFFRLGPSARPAVGDLDQALDGPDKPLRVAIARALLRVDPAGSRARVIAALAAILRDQSVRMEHYNLVATLVAAQGEDATAALLIPLIKDPDLATRIQALNDLTSHCRRAKALKPALVEALESGDGFSRTEAAIFFLQHEPEMSSRAIDSLADVMANPDGFDRDLIRRIRGASKPSLKPLASRLLELLIRPAKPGSRTNILIALGEIGPAAVAAVPALLELSKSNDLGIATRATESLVKIDPRTAETRLDSLVGWVSAGNAPAVRVSAIASLRDLGPAAVTAVPALLSAADEDDIVVSAAAIEAIGRIDPITAKSLKQAIAANVGSRGDQAR
jgi:HEAT repeats